jgi:hypothetical protein
LSNNEGRSQNARLQMSRCAELEALARLKPDLKSVILSRQSQATVQSA